MQEENDRGTTCRARFCAGRRRFLQHAAVAAGVALAPRRSGAEDKRQNLAAAAGPETLARHPAGTTLTRLFPNVPAARLPPNFVPAGRGRRDYLPLIVGNAAFFANHQDANGAIIDPFEKRERQYATPAFALAAATSATAAGRGDLLDPAVRAFTFALDALAGKTTADNHADFYIPLLMHAHRLLQNRVPRTMRDRWRQQFLSLVPEKAYRDTGGRGNWNIVHVAGECLRRKDGLVAPVKDADQSAYIERCLGQQKASGAYTPLGLYRELNVPLAYDAFARLWLEDALANGAYRGAHYGELQEFLTRGGLSTLLLLSPAGEWANGGRSSQHQWNEAQVAALCEINARRWKAWGRSDVAGAFKRAAHLALASVRRWQRPSGELWIVKNRAEPARRHGYEGYSFHSQYNLLAAAMLAMAYEHADDRIREYPVPSETGCYVFDLRDPFHKVCAAAGGTYALVDTAADPHYDASGLLRVHAAGVSLSPFSGVTAPGRWYGPPSDLVKVGLSPGIAWQEKEAGQNDVWRSLADFASGDKKASGGAIADTFLSVRADVPSGQVRFLLLYRLTGAGARPVKEEYTVSSAGVAVISRVDGGGTLNATRVQFPALVSDGNRDTQIRIEGAQATIDHADASLTWTVVSPPGAQLHLQGPRIPTHNGFVRALAADLPVGTREVRWHVRLAPRSAASAKKLL